MKSNDLRQAFVDYFQKHGHTAVASSPLIPQDDNTLLFANAGMNQFKNAFLGLEKRPYARAVSAQKCVRAGGKHNDLENVGFTARHHTFFEMMGNFSFGDYFKKEAIHYAWDFLTNTLAIPKDKLYVTVHTSDDEAEEIWRRQENVPAARIFRFDDDNFWRMGDTGPCGPSSEIFFDHGPAADPTGTAQVGDDKDRFVEIWNLVFMQYHESEEGRSDLPNPSIDTGAGLERLAAALQGQFNNYDTDVFAALLNKAAELSGAAYQPQSQDEKVREQLAAMRVLADHARATAFLIADGVLPSNEGRGYVLRRILRRALRYGRKLSPQSSFLPAMSQVVVESMNPFYPELAQKKSLILATAEDEEERFLQTLDQGTQILSQALDKLHTHGQTTLPGELSFKLYDTYGFPVDLTRLMAAERGFEVDEADFEKHMQEARSKARASWKGSAISADDAHLVQLAQQAGPTQFSGYERTNDAGRVLALSSGSESVNELRAGQSGVLILDRSCFYAESGGQVADRGQLHAENFAASVSDCQKQGETFLLTIEVQSGQVQTGDTVHQDVTSSERRQTACNHSATHLLHSALRATLGDHVTQAGSLVGPERLRFDYTHSKPLSADELQELENWVHQEISAAHDTQTVLTDPQSAIEKEGALALFGEKYGDEVRVVKMGPHSAELCGGTHVANTSMIRLFKIVSDSGVSAGVRRIEALTGDRAVEFLLAHYRENSAARAQVGLKVSWASFLESPRENTMSDWIDKNLARQRELDKEIKALKGAQIDIEALVAKAQAFACQTPGGQSASGRLVTQRVPFDDRKVLSDVIDKVKDKIQSGVVVLLGEGQGSHPLLVAVSKDLSRHLRAGEILKQVAQAMGGKGGGRPDFAQGAVSDLSKAEEGFAQARAFLGL